MGTFDCDERCRLGVTRSWKQQVKLCLFQGPRYGPDSVEVKGSGTGELTVVSRVLLCGVEPLIRGRCSAVNEVDARQQPLPRTPRTRPSSY